jgi:potassium channel subfamily K, other eukaryote
VDVSFLNEQAISLRRGVRLGDQFTSPLFAMTQGDNDHEEHEDHFRMTERAGNMLKHGDINNNNAYNEHEDHYHKTERHRHLRRPFFGVPIVGFFRPREVKTNLRERSPFFNDQVDVLEYGTASPPSDMSVSEHRKKSGKELWDILRYHVSNESFHIQDTLKVHDEASTDDIHFENVDLPYDFSLLDCFLALAVYLLISIIAFSFVFERWTIIDSMYFAVVTFTTIGYGDFSPTTMAGKLFCALFALAGVAVLAIGLGVVGSKIIEAEVQSITAAEHELVKDVSAVFQKRSDSARERQVAYAKSHSHDSSSFSYLAGFDDPAQSIRDRLEDVAHPGHKTRKMCAMFFNMLARYIPALTPLFVGSFLIGHYEGWTWEDCIYYCVVTTTTIGYGDLTPQMQSTRLFAVLFIPLAVGAMGHFLGTVANFIVDQRTRVHHKRLWKHELTVEDLRTMSSSEDGTVTELDFLVFMLQAMKKVDSDLIDKIREHFRNLDLTHSGTLVRGDLELMAKRKLRTSHAKLQLAAYKAQLMKQSSCLSSPQKSDSEDPVD